MGDETWGDRKDAMVFESFYAAKLLVLKMHGCFVEHDGSIVPPKYSITPPIGD